ncbi:barstar family protein [Actinocrispum sp. NPDC049592]|uniref:barstar family protein n=1 Tax=Actinocrispum sp. NPDC049592 TaxID=3154835 RepID=UPI00342AD8A7
MSALTDLLEVGPPFFHLTDGDPTSGIAALSDTAVVRRIRGARSRTAPRFFDEIAAAYQFPSYFGSNWAALRDMLGDFSWLRAKAYVFVIDSADEFLAEEDDSVLVTGLSVLAGSASSAGSVPFHFVLQAPADGRIAKALGANGIPFDTVV